MGFYGNITNVNKSTFQFDKIYPNRVAMDAAATTDGIFSGRYVLVDYDEGASLDSITEVFNSNVESISSGNVVIIPGYKRKIWDAESEEYYDVAPRQFYTGLPSYLPDESDLDETSIHLLDKDSILAGTYVLCLGIIEEKTENIGTENEPNLKTTYHLNQNEPKKLYMAVINNDILDFEDVASSFNTLVDLFGSNFLINYTVDVKYYENKGISIGRGWDSTVWQKTYKDGEMTYVMVAELNSVVPTFDIAVDAPTESLTKPYWDSDSSNVYYKLHVPAVKNLRIRSASGEDSKNNEGVWSNDQSTWKEYKTDFEKEDLAIYWNKAGFEKYISGINTVEKDSILLEYTGFSDNYYNDNRKNSPTYAQQVLHEFPDTYELSMCLPSIGNAAAQFWNMVYGEGKVKDTLGKYLYDKDKIKFAEDNESVLVRNTNYEWNTRNGERASKIFDENLEKTVYGYNSDALNNLAGSINSLHDLIGMNIIKKDGLTEDSDSSQFDPHNIYYSNGKYFRKEKAYKFGTNIGISGSNMIDPSKGNYYRLESYAYQNYEKEDHSEEEYHNYWKVQSNDIIKEDEVYGTIHVTSVSGLTPENFNPLTEDEDEFLYTRSNSQPYIYEKVTDNIPTNAKYYKITSVQQVNNKEIFYLPGLYYLGVKHFENLEEKNEWINKPFENKDYDSLSLRNEERMSDALKAVGAIDNQGNENELVIANFLKGVELDTEATTYVYVDKNLIQEDVAQNDDHLNADGTIYTLTVGDNTYSSPLQNKTNSIIEVNGTAVPSYHYYAQVYRKTGSTELHSLQYWAEHSISSSEALILVQDLRREISQPVYSLNNARVVELQDIEGDYLNYYWKNTNEYIYGQLTKNDIKQYYKNGEGQAAAVWFTLNISEPQIYYNLDTGYYSKDSNDNYIRETATRLKSNVDVENYYTVTWTPTNKRIFIPNTYYYYDRDNSTWELETDLNNERVYYRYPGVYVVSDENNRYPVGFRWKAPDAVPEGLIWGNKGFDWKFKEIPELADGENTIHGLILKINKMLSAGDKITRDDSTVQGSINSLNDITSNFSELNSGEILMSDKLRRIHSASASGDDWIKITTTPGENPDFKPTIKLEHKFTKGTDETSTLDLNSDNIDNKDVIELYTPQLDDKGHVVAKNIKTVTLPYGFKTISIGAESSVVGNLAHAAADLVAENTQDTLIINSGNKWVKLAGAASNDSFSIGHLVQTIDTVASNSDINGNGNTITIQDITNDEAGHITANKAHTYTLPYGFKTITGNNGSLIADSTQATVAFNGDTWIQTTASSTGVEFTHNNPDNITHTAVNNETPNFGETFTIKDLDFDSKGHKANEGTHTITLPLPTIQDAKEVVSGIEQPVQGNVLIDLAVDKDNVTNTSTGTFTKTKAYIGNLQLNGYNKNDVDTNNLDLISTNTLNEALEKLEYRLNEVEAIKPESETAKKYSYSAGEENYDILQCAKTWLQHNNELYYGNSGNPNSFNRVNGINSLVTEINPETINGGKYPLDCMSFVMMCLMGIGFEQSIFGDKTNISYYPKSSINFLSDEVCKFIKYQRDGGVREFQDNMEFERLLTWQFAMYLDSVGMYYHIDPSESKVDMLKGLKTGDILFEGDPTNLNYNQRFESIYHVMIYIGNTRFGTPLIIECSSDTDYPVKVRWRTLENLNIVGYTRIPLGNSVFKNVADVTTFSKATNSCTQIAMLNKPIEMWDTFKVTVTCTYKNTENGMVYPAVKIGSRTWTRFNEVNMPPIEVNNPVTLNMYVCISPMLMTNEGETIPDTSIITVGFFDPNQGFVANDEIANIEIVNIKSLMHTPKEKETNVYLPTYFGNLSDQITAIAGYLSNNTIRNFECNFNIIYNDSNYDGYFIKFNTNNYMAILCNFGRHGVIYDMSNGEETVTVYMNENLIDWNFAALVLK